MIPNSGRWIQDVLSTSLVTIENKVFVPLLDIVRLLGMTVTYDPRTRRTFITTGRVRRSPLIYEGKRERKLVALTFDDGPEAIYTPQIIDALKDKGVLATFFVVGQQIRRHPNIMRRIVQEGHGIANHTFTHPSLPDITTSDVVQELTATQQELANTVGRRPDLFRPPFGAVTWSDEKVITQLGFRIIMWSVDTLDWTGLSAEEIVEIVLRDITPGGIVLQHNIETDPNLLQGSVEAIPLIIDELREQGYTFVTVQTMLD